MSGDSNGAKDHAPIKSTGVCCTDGRSNSPDVAVVAGRWFTCA